MTREWRKKRKNLYDISFLLYFFCCCCWSHTPSVVTFFFYYLRWLKKIKYVYCCVLYVVVFGYCRSLCFFAHLRYWWYWRCYYYNIHQSYERTNEKKKKNIHNFTLHLLGSQIQLRSQSKQFFFWHLWMNGMTWHCVGIMNISTNI